MFGILAVNKPVGLTSRDCVNRVQRLIRPHKVGHAGTLDPLATGVLVLCIGRATRLVEFVQQQEKHYRGTFQLGQSSTTEDTQGELTVLSDPPIPSRDQLAAILPEFVGAIQQVPPIFSALKVKGRRSYKLAREGKEVQLQPRTIQIRHLQIVSYEYPTLVLDIKCGSGTYVRSLGRDVARRVGTEGVMSALVRTSIGDYSLDSTCQLADISLASLHSLMRPATTAVAHLPHLELDAREIEEVIHARPIPNVAEIEAEHIAALDAEGNLLAILTPYKQGFLKPQRNFTAANKEN
ncbi:MAG: tRNA pseudouridine55 synthase [Pirellulaceae bacterium]|jgi:tRNA pseudouridine55 synthase